MPSITDLFNPRRWMFTLMYWRGMTPWDTGITPPELRAVIEGVDATPPGRALDIGCGTGTNALYLARHGWEVFGIDFARPAIARARSRLRMAQRADSGGLALAHKVRFVQGDATRLREMGATGLYQLVYDIGCLHGIPRDRRARYAEEIAAVTAPGALFMLYSFEPRPDGGPIGISSGDLEDLFGRAFEVMKRERGSDRGDRVSVWTWLRRRVTG